MRLPDRLIEFKERKLFFTFFVIFLSSTPALSKHNLKAVQQQIVALKRNIATLEQLIRKSNNDSDNFYNQPQTKKIIQDTLLQAQKLNRN